MKKMVILGLAVLLLLLPLLTTGCVTGQPVTVELSLDDFATNNDIVLNYTLNQQETLTVKLGTNPTTGYDWQDAMISDPGVIEQVSRDYLAPTAEGLVGAPGTTVWVFNAKADGTAFIQFNYCRSWESIPATYKLTINITVE